jgi:hypothetical protein
MRHLTTCLCAVVAASVLALTAPAFAQKPKPTPPKKDEPKATPESEPKKDPPAEPETKPADETPAEPKAKENVEPPHDEWDIYDVEEKPGKAYMFVGLRYRGTIIPKFMINLFVDEGATIYSNSIGVEFDYRKDGFSLIPALSYVEYGTDDILFKQKGKDENIPGNYSVVNSGMKGIYATADLLWSTKLSKQVEFEYGAGFGLGIIFGPLKNNWVQLDPNGSLHASTGKNYSQCPAGEGAKGTGCSKADHQNSDQVKTGGYEEPSWFDGGSKPVIFPHVAIPQVGLRIKPIKNFVGRIHLGFSLTGFWFGINGEYGLEQKPKP